MTGYPNIRYLSQTTYLDMEAQLYLGNQMKQHKLLLLQIMHKQLLSVK